MLLAIEYVFALKNVKIVLFWHGVVRGSLVRSEMWTPFFTPRPKSVNTGPNKGGFLLYGGSA